MAQTLNVECERCTLYQSNGFGPVCNGCMYQEFEEDQLVNGIDPAINPTYYKRGGFECIDILEAVAASPESFQDFCRITALAYLWRLGEKDDVLREAKKTAWYIDRMIQSIEKQRSEK